MSEQKALFRDFIDVVLTKGDAAASDRFIDPSFVDHQPWPGHPGTLAGFKAGLLEMRAAFPDLAVRAERMVEEGDTVAIVIEMSGTHLGSFGGVAATGKTFRVQGIDMLRVRGGKLVEHWGFFDTEAMMKQLGVAAS